MTHRIPCKQEELPFAASILKNNFVRDLDEFTGYSAVFNQAYADNLEVKITQVANMAQTDSYIGEIALLTERIYKNSDSLRPLLTKLEGYLKMASQDNIKIKLNKFNIKDIRDAISSRDIEKMLSHLKNLGTNVVKNMPALVAQGYTQAAFDKLVQTGKAISADNNARNTKMDQRDINTQTNERLLNELWSIMQLIMDMGKRIYKYTDPARLNDYTMTKIIEKLKRERKKKAKKE